MTVSEDALETLTTFYVGEWRFGVPSGEIREVIRNPRVTTVPLLPAEIQGVFNVRGEIVTAIDLRRRLGLPEAHDRPAAHLVIETAEGTASLVVDRPGDVLRVARSRFEMPPAQLWASARECVLGAYKIDEELILLLDSTRTLSLPVEPGTASIAVVSEDREENRE